MKLLSLLSLLLPILATVRGQSSVSLGLSTSTTPITRRFQNSADEGETFLVCLNTNNGAPSTTSTVRVESEDGTATAPDDYNSVSVTLTFNQGTIEECVSLMLVDDDLEESDEWLLVRINGETGDYSNFEAIVNITISGGSSVGISLEQDSYDVSESEGSVEVCAKQNGNVPNLDGNIVVRLTTSSTSGSTAATVGSDYTQVSRELVFVPASAGTRNCVDIPITQDELAEGNEVFQVNLETQNIFYQSFIGPIRTATITIADEPSTEPPSDTEATDPPSDTEATEPPSDTDATEPTSDTDATDDDTTTPTATPPTDDGGASDDPTTGGDMNTDGTTSTPPGGDSNPNTPNTGSNPNDNGEGPDSDGNVSEDNDAPETVGVSDYGVTVRSLSPILLLLVSCWGLLL